MEKKSGLLQKPASGEGASPESSDALDAFVANGMKIIHSKQMMQQALPAILKSDEPTREIADYTLNVVSRLEESGKQNGMKLPPEVLAQGANILMGQIIEVAELSGMKPMNDEEKYMAFSLAVSKYIDDAVKSGKMTPEQLQRLSMEAQSTEEGQKILGETQNAAGQVQKQTERPGQLPQEPVMKAAPAGRA